MMVGNRNRDKLENGVICSAHFQGLYVHAYGWDLKQETLWPEESDAFSMLCNVLVPSKQGVNSGSRCFSDHSKLRN